MSADSIKTQQLQVRILNGRPLKAYGDTLFFRVTSSQDMGKERVVYADLLDESGTAVLRQKLLPCDRMAEGRFALPHDSLIRIEALRVYTREMLERDAPQVCMIPIFRDRPDAASCVMVGYTGSIEKAAGVHGLSLEGRIVSVGKKKLVDGLIVHAVLKHPVFDRRISLYNTVGQDGIFYIPVPDIYGSWNLALWCEHNGKKTIRYRPLLRRHLIPSALPDFSDTMRTSYFVDAVSLMDSIYATGGKIPDFAQWLASLPTIKREFKKSHRAMGWNGVAYSLSPSRTLTYRKDNMMYRVFHTFKTGQVSAYRTLDGDFPSKMTDVLSMNKNINIRSYTEEGAPDLTLNDVEWLIIDVSDEQENLLPSFRREKLAPFRPFNIWFGYTRPAAKQVKGVRFTSFDGYTM